MTVGLHFRMGAARRRARLQRVARLAPPEPSHAERARDLEANPGVFYVDYGDFKCLRFEVGSI